MDGIADITGQLAMFFFARSMKERIVSFGVLAFMFMLLISSLLGLVLSVKDGVKYVCINIVLFLFAFILSSLIFFGCKFGYSVGKFVAAILAVVYIPGSMNPFIYQDIQMSGGSFAQWFVTCIAFGALCIFVFYSLDEHAKIRYRE